MRKIRYFLSGRLFPCALVYALFLALTVGLAIYLPRALAPVMALERIFALTATLAVALSDADPAAKTGKLTLIVLLPWTGAILCLLLGKPQKQTKIAPVRGVFSDTAFDRLGATVSSQCGIKPCFAETTTYFATGAEFFPALIKAISSAKKFVWLEYYIVADGVFWNTVLSALTERAHAGADVRLVYDDFGCALTLPKRLPKELRKRGITAQPSKKLRPFSPIRSSVRNHRKCAIIDGETVFLGGINIADEYIGKSIRFGHWKDTAISVTGEPARAFAAEFARRFPPCMNILSRMKVTQRTDGEIPCIPVLDTAYRAGLVSLAGTARQSLYLCTPYLAPDDKTFYALKSAAEAGIDVRIMIPHIPDKKSVFTLTRRYARRLVDCGVQVREYTAGFLHAKSVTADGQIAGITSHNLDYRSLKLQRECGAFVCSRPLAEAVEKDFLNLWEDGTEVPAPTRLEEIFGAILSLFTPIF